VALALLAGCSGLWSVEVSLSAAELSVQAVPGGPTPIAAVTLSYSWEPARAPVVHLDHTRQAIDRVELRSAGFDADAVVLTFKDPATLGVGAFHDTLHLRVCEDEACSRVLRGGDRTVEVNCVVTGAAYQVPTPVVTAFLPAHARTGFGVDAGLALTLLGSGFTDYSQVLWNGAPRATTRLSQARLVVQLPAEDLLFTTAAEVTVSNEAVAESRSVPRAFQVLGPETPPALTGLSPTSVVADAREFVLTASGEGFDPGSQLEWDGLPLATTWRSGELLEAAVPPSRFPSARTAAVTVRASGNGKRSGGLPVLVTPPPPVLLVSVSPGRVLVGSLPVVLTVQGYGFGASATVLWNGTPLSTTNFGWLEAQVDVPQLTHSGTFQVSVATATETSSSLPVEVVRWAAQDAVSVQLDPGHTGAGAYNDVQLPDAATWRAELGGLPSYPLIAEGKVFAVVAFPDGGFALVARDLATGAPAWGPVALPGPANAAYEDAGVYTYAARPDAGAVMQAFEASTGAPRWSTTLEPLTSWLPPGLTASGGLIYTGADAASTMAIPPSYGFSLMYGVRESDGVVARTLPEFRQATPAVWQGRAFTVRDVYYAWPERWQTGALLWPVNTDRGLYQPRGVPDATHAPAVGPLVAYEVVTGGVTAAPFDRPGVYSSGPSWTVALPGGASPATSLLSVNHYAIVATGQTLLALDGRTGEVAWSQDLGAPIASSLPGGDFAPVTALAAAHGMLVVPAGTGLTAFRLASDP
jgi:hypothetical protein